MQLSGKAVFFDRDGVINDLVDRGENKTAPWSAREFHIKPNVKEAVDLVKSLGYNAFVVTNQPDVIDGHLSSEDLYYMNCVLIDRYGFDDVFCAMERDTVYYKPNNGMVEHYIYKYNLDRNKCFLMGDRWKDIVAGKRSFIKTIYIGENYTRPDEYYYYLPDGKASDILEACEMIKEWS